MEYVELVGKKLGDNQWVGQNVPPRLSQEQIASELGMDIKELKRILQIERNLIPELKQALDKI